MLTGLQLGKAIRHAVALKMKLGVKKAEIAAHFGVRPPSVNGWEKTGAIDKAKLPTLWAYFSDVVGPEHWGLQDWPAHNIIGVTSMQRVEKYQPHNHHIEAVIAMMRGEPEEMQAQCVGAVSAILRKKPPRPKKQTQRTGT